MVAALRQGSSVIHAAQPGDIRQVLRHAATRAGGRLAKGRREEFTGPLRVSSIGLGVIWEEMDKQAVVKGLHRQEQTEYPQSSVREALVNAVAHRDYRLTGRSIGCACTPTDLR